MQFLLFAGNFSAVMSRQLFFFLRYFMLRLFVRFWGVLKSFKITPTLVCLYCRLLSSVPALCIVQTCIPVQNIPASCLAILFSTFEKKKKKKKSTDFPALNCKSFVGGRVKARIAYYIVYNAVECLESGFSSPWEGSPGWALGRTGFLGAVVQASCLRGERTSEQPEWMGP